MKIEEFLKGRTKKELEGIVSMWFFLKDSKSYTSYQMTADRKHKIEINFDDISLWKKIRLWFSVGKQIFKK